MSWNLCPAHGTGTSDSEFLSNDRVFRTSRSSLSSQSGSLDALPSLNERIQDDTMSGFRVGLLHSRADSECPTALRLEYSRNGHGPDFCR